MKHQVYHRPVNHSFATGWQRLVVIAQPTILAKPTEGPFHHPTSGQYDEPIQLATLDNLNHPPEHTSSPFDEYRHWVSACVRHCVELFHGGDHESSSTDPANETAGSSNGRCPKVEIRAATYARNIRYGSNREYH
jgi:hypothetical protein